MKKGCFIQAVVIVTVLVAAAIYIIQYKLDDWFIKPTKKFLVSEAIKNWDNEVKHINESVQKDSLRSLMIYYIENVKSMEEVVNLEEEKFIKEFNLVIKDSLITDEEISKLTLLLKKEQNEKSKSNRN
ncbi:MAG: hypothetical protein A2W30_07700 [Ignavibacteria bacterium RBG_16_36_9]|nr:MAG: hypothetical protein A2W30_07700 [Ignavibacteria bacterium RBG_16_36_9]